MTDRTGFFAGLSDILTQMCCYYAVAAVLIMGEKGWGLHLFWLLLCAGAWALVYALVLRRPRTVPFLTALTAVLFLASMAVFWLASSMPMRFGYGFLLAVGAGMAVGLPLKYALHRPLIHQHLGLLDVLILVLMTLLLVREVRNIDGFTVLLTTLVLLMDAAAAVGLRMTDGGDGDGASAFRASMTALAAAGALALVIGLLVLLFSGSGALTGSVLQGIGAFFSGLGRGLERFFRWLFSFVRVRDESAPLELEEIPSLAAIENETVQSGFEFRPGAAAAVLAVLLLAAAVTTVILLRKERVARGTLSVSASSDNTVRRTGGTARAIWQRILARLRFRWTAFVRRDTPGGVLLALERRGRRARRPREPGETMRCYIFRMDPTGGLAPLADALDREYYGALSSGLTPAGCRALRRYIRKVV